MGTIAQQGRVLIVDDDRTTLVLCGRILTQAGFRVQDIRQGRTALTLLETEIYDLVLLDLHMPDLDGLAMLQQLRAQGNSVPVLIITSQASTEHLATAVRLGIQGILQKPIKADELRELVVELIHQGRDRHVQTLAHMLRSFVRLSQIPPAQLNLVTFCTILQETLGQELPIDRCALLLYDPTTATLRPADEIGESSLSLVPPSVIGNDFMAEAVRRQQTIQLASDEANAMALRISNSDEPVQSALLVPLLVSEGILGVLVLARLWQTDPFSANERELVEALAQHAAAIINGRRQHLEMLHEASVHTHAIQQQARTEKISAVARLAAAIAHEMNNPLQAIHNSLHLVLHRPISPEKRTRYLELAQHELDGLIHLVRRTLDCYQPAPDGLRPLQLVSLIESMLDMIEPQLKQHELRLQRAIDPGLPPVLAVAGHIRQALSNILSNAIEATPRGGTITINARPALSDPNKQPATQPAWVEIEIADTGTGIVPEQLSYIFEPFYSTKANSNGLGLTISHNIISYHGGQLSIQSRPGERTVVSIRLPTAHAEGY